MNSLINDIKIFMKNTRFSLDDDTEDNFLLYSTRENGDMENDKVGEEDILRARQIRDALHKKFPIKQAYISTCDEWVFINIEV